MNVLLDYGRSAMLEGRTESEWLFKHRTARGITQTQLSEASGVSTAAISKIEAGKSGMSDKTVRLLAPHLAPVDATDAEINAIVDEGLFAAGYAPGGHTLKVVRVQHHSMYYEPILDDLEVAAQSGNLDDEAVRRIRRQIQIESDEAARRRGVQDDREVEARPDEQSGHNAGERFERLELPKKLGDFKPGAKDLDRGRTSS